MKTFKNRLSLKWILTAFLSAVLFGCTADYDTFGTSDYRKMNEIAFEEQDGNATVYPDEHKIMVTLSEIPDSLDTWDSVAIGNLDISSMATLHLVTSKFKEFPQDSATLDSLSQEVSYAKERLREGDKIRIPSSGVVYVVVVSESGIPDLWQIAFEIPEKKESDKSSSSGKGSSKSSSSAKDSDKDDSSSSAKKETSSSSSKGGDSASSGKSSASGEEPESSSSVEVPANAPKLLRFIAGAGEVEGEIDQDAGTVFLNMDYAIDLDLCDLEIKGLDLSDGATANVKVGESYDFSRGLKVANVPTP